MYPRNMENTAYPRLWGSTENSFIEVSHIVIQKSYHLQEFQTARVEDASHEALVQSGNRAYIQLYTKNVDLEGELKGIK